MKIARLRQQKKMTQAQLAEICGTTQQQIAKIEKGIVDPKLSTMRRLASAFSCELPDLFWTKREFLFEVRQVLEKHRMEIDKLEFLKLYELCTSERNLPAFHPYWEELEIRNQTLTYREPQGD